MTLNPRTKRKFCCTTFDEEKHPVVQEKKGKICSCFSFSEETQQFHIGGREWISSEWCRSGQTKGLKELQSRTLAHIVVNYHGHGAFLFTSCLFLVLFFGLMFASSICLLLGLALILYVFQWTTVDTQPRPSVLVLLVASVFIIVRWIQLVTCFNLTVRGIISVMKLYPIEKIPLPPFLDVPASKNVIDCLNSHYLEATGSPLVDDIVSTSLVLNKVLELRQRPMLTQALSQVLSIYNLLPLSLNNVCQDYL
jgi:hypothetical protein